VIEMEIQGEPSSFNDGYGDVYKVSFRCPGCGMIVRFQLYCPVACDKCLRKLPNIVPLLAGIKPHVMSYHLTGKIEDKNRDMPKFLWRFR
jgi:hypothetical protein